MIITPRLRKLLLKMTSPFEKEVMAARDAITAALNKEGKDWHDLLDALGQPQQAQPPPWAHMQPPPWWGMKQPVRQGKKARSWIKVKKTPRPEPDFFDKRGEPEAPKRTTPRRTTFPAEGERITKDEWLDLIYLAWEGRDNLSDKDRGFVASLLQPYFSRAGAYDEPSQRQQNWFREAFKRATQKAA